jgi:hypothetical protein
VDQRQHDALAQQLDRVGMAELVVVPTSAQASICRHLRYADVDETLPSVSRRRRV